MEAGTRRKISKPTHTVIDEVGPMQEYLYSGIGRAGVASAVQRSGVRIYQSSRTISMVCSSGVLQLRKRHRIHGNCDSISIAAAYVNEELRKSCDDSPTPLQFPENPIAISLTLKLLVHTHAHIYTHTHTQTHTDRSLVAMIVF